MKWKSEIFTSDLVRTTALMCIHEKEKEKMF